MLSSIRALMVGAVVTGLTVAFFGGAAPASAQCAAGSLVTPNPVVVLVDDADACGGNLQLLAETVAAPATSTTVPLFATSTRTTVSAEGDARDTWKFLLGGLGIIAVVGGVLRTATGRKRY